jgi:hypothetical protein
MSIEKFKNDALEAITRFITLDLMETIEIPFLKGSLDIVDRDGKHWHSYDVEIHYTTRYPYVFPTVFETGGAIRRIADWHINNDGSCCLDNEFSQKIKCFTGLSVESFISPDLLPWLANQSYRRITGNYANGEQGHGDIGRIEFFLNEFKAPNLSICVDWMKEFSKGKIYPRQSICFCGSGKKWRHCHKAIFEKLKPIRGAALNWAIYRFTDYLSKGYGFLLNLQHHSTTKFV